MNNFNYSQPRGASSGDGDVRHFGPLLNDADHLGRLLPVAYPGVGEVGDSPTVTKKLGKFWK